MTPGPIPRFFILRKEDKVGIIDALRARVFAPDEERVIQPDGGSLFLELPEPAIGLDRVLEELSQDNDIKVTIPISWGVIDEDDVAGRLRRGRTVPDGEDFIAWAFFGGKKVVLKTPGGEVTESPPQDWLKREVIETLAYVICGGHTDRKQMVPCCTVL